MTRDYEIMSGETLVAVWRDSALQVVCADLLPLFLKRLSDADAWLATRAVDSHRANSRLLKKALRLTEKDDVSTVLHVNGVTITDNYWVRPIGSGLTYADVSFQYDYFSKRVSSLALGGSFAAFNYVANHSQSKTYELTNVGSFEKCWKLKDGAWWLYKKATQREQFSELFAYKLGQAIGIPVAVYERTEDCVRSLDFTGGASVNFEPAISFMGENEEYEDVIEKLGEICPAAIPAYIQMIFLDTIIANPDRHTGNFGLLRDTKTGKYLGLAPCFDHNMAVISRGYASNPKHTDLLITLFNAVMKAYPEYKAYLPTVSEETVRTVIKEIGMKVRTQPIVDLVMSRYEMVK